MIVFGKWYSVGLWNISHCITIHRFWLVFLSLSCLFMHHRCIPIFGSDRSEISDLRITWKSGIKISLFCPNFLKFFQNLQKIEFQFDSIGQRRLFNKTLECCTTCGAYFWNRYQRIMLETFPNLVMCVCNICIYIYMATAYSHMYADNQVKKITWNSFFYDNAFRAHLK